MDWDRENLARLYERYGGGVFQRACRLLGDSQAAKDACHEVFMRLHQARPDFSLTSPVTWLYRVTTNHCLNVIRDRTRQQGLLERNRRDDRAVAAPVPLERLLEGIPAELHEVALYYHVDEMTQDEIALVLGISQRTVSNRLSAFRNLARVAWADVCPEVL